MKKLALPKPYVIFLGDTQNPLDAKTALGLVDWCIDDCVAQISMPGCKIDLNLPELTPSEAAAAGAKSIVIGIAPTGGQIKPEWRELLKEALSSGLHLISGLHIDLEDDETLREAGKAGNSKLINLRRAPERKQVASGKNRTGKGGNNLILKVPIGTQVFEEDNKTMIYDFKNEKEEFIVANGGKGGLGNTRFKSSTNRAPRKFTKGITGEEYVVWLQLKTIADIGIIGLPNAGKSSLLAAITSATPKIANYKFTTLNPNLGVAVYDDKEITLADIPGIIEGAHTGIGLGIKFLKHIERCKTLIHLIDITEENIENLYKQVRNELGKYSKKLLKKDELVVFNKIDLIDKNKLNEKKNKFLKKIKKKVITISTFDKTSIKTIKSKLIKY